MLAAIDSNAAYARYRRQHGDKAARRSGLGQATSFRLKVDAKGWRVFVTTETVEVPVMTDRKLGVVGGDLNADHLAIAETDASGNYVRAFRVPLVTYGKSRHQAEALIGDAVARIVECAQRRWQAHRDGAVGLSQQDVNARRRVAQVCPDAVGFRLWQDTGFLPFSGSS